MRVRGGRPSKTLWRRKRGDWGGGLQALESTGLLTQDADPGGTALADDYNGFNEMIHLAILWMVSHRWPV